MIYDLPETRQKQVAAGLFLAAVLVVLSVTVLPVWLTNAGYDAEVTRLQSRLVSLQGSSEADEALRPELERLVAAHSRSGHHLKSDTEAVAAAELQRIVANLASSNTVQLLSTQILPASEEEDFIRISLRVRARGTLEGISETLYDVESNPTFLFLDSVSIRAGARRRLQRSTTDNQFEAEFDLSAYMPRPLS